MFFLIFRWFFHNVKFLDAWQHLRASIVIPLGCIVISYCMNQCVYDILNKNLNRSGSSSEGIMHNLPFATWIFIGISGLTRTKCSKHGNIRQICLIRNPKFFLHSVSLKCYNFREMSHVDFSLFIWKVFFFSKLHFL